MLTTVLGHAAGKVTVADAIERLELLALSWHGGDLEPRTISALAKLYVEAGRWRQAMMTARRADSTGTDSPLVRDVHDMAQTLFEDLYLGERSSKLSGVEALALYFDFKEFAPLGRRGDEIGDQVGLGPVFRVGGEGREIRGAHATSPQGYRPRHIVLALDVLTKDAHDRGPTEQSRGNLQA